MIDIERGLVALDYFYGQAGELFSFYRMQVSEDDETYQNPVDLLFEDLGKKKPKSFAVRQYKLYKLAAGKTAKSILISCGARLAPFDIQEVRDATMYDELELDKLGDRKTALFLIMSDTDSTFNFLISMIYTQLFNLLCDKADDVYGGKGSALQNEYSLLPERKAIFMQILTHLIFLLNLLKTLINHFS